MNPAIDLHPAVFNSFDLPALGLLPRGWDDAVRRAAREHGQTTVLDGTSPTSCEPVPGTPFEVHVLSGHEVRSELPWLWRLYGSTLLDMVSAVGGYRAHVARDERIAINVNLLRGTGGRYEWHVDSNPMTGLLFVDTLTPEDGGALCFRTARGLQHVVPRAGLFLAFDAREVPHAVLPLARDIERISIPMNYYASATDQPRPPGLDDYMYRDLEVLAEAEHALSA